MILDTNVLLTANGDAQHAPAHCVTRCLETLVETRHTAVALDMGQEILAEYHRNVRNGFPLGPALQFVRELLQNLGNPERCELVFITPDGTRGYAEFPGDDRLAAFDPSDRKFVAVSIASPSQHEILNAVDTDWAPADAALRAHGVEVRYLCPSFTRPPGTA